MKKTLLALSALVFMLGCESKPQTVAHYMKNIDDAQERVADCKEIEEKSESEKKDCRAAKTAVRDFKKAIEIGKEYAKYISHDFGANYTAHGSYRETLQKMTGAQLVLAEGNPSKEKASAYVVTLGKKCIRIETEPKGTLTVSKGNDSDSDICELVLKNVPKSVFKTYNFGGYK